jgi:hypothetical protein
MNMLKKTFTLICTIFLVQAVLLAQQELFPQLKSYKTVNEYPVYTPDDLWNYIDGAADAYLALGFIDLNITEYVKGKKKIKAEIYRFADDAMAFGIYSLERSPEYDFIAVGVQGYNEEGVVNFYKDRYYIKIMTQSRSEKVNDTMKQLAVLVATAIKGNNEFPAMLRLFPEEGRLKNEETFILESVLGHEFLRGAFRASYEVDNDRFEIYLFNCRSSDDASSMAAKLAGDAYTADDDVFKYILNDGFNGTLFMAQQGERFIIISGLDSSRTVLAERYISSMLTQ